jgi:hypothetical protein
LLSRKANSKTRTKKQLVAELKKQLDRI